MHLALIEIANHVALKQEQMVALEQTQMLATTELSLASAWKEFVAMLLFVVIGCGSAMAMAKKSQSWELQVSMTFGLAIAALAAATGCQINCAVTFGMCILGYVTIIQGLVNLLAQLLGSVVGAFFLAIIFPPNADATGSLGSNSINDTFSTIQVLIAEFLMTFLLMFVAASTLHPTESAAAQMSAPISIGFAVFLAHSVLIPLDGCSINPTRSFGPALVAKLTKDGSGTFRDMWVFWLGPLAGAAAAAGVYKWFLL